MAAGIHLPDEPDNDVTSSASSPTSSHSQFPPVARPSTVQLRPLNLAPASAISPGPLQPSAPTICNGPASGLAFIPPRPKPGRKPASDEPENKRKAQNRAAQRAFRERKLQGQHQLEYENKDLKVVNDNLAKDLQQLRENVTAGKRRIEELEAEVAEGLRREGEFRERQERNATSMTALQQRARDAEASAEQTFQDNQTLRAELEALKAKLSEVVTGTTSVSAENYHYSTAAQAHPANGIVSRVVNGCGDCDENGDCPCVDSYLESAATTRPTMAAIHRNSSMSIDTLLAPVNSSARTNSIPDLVSDHSSPEDMEIDFTYAMKPSSHTSFPYKSERCGFCEDGGKCICAEIEADTAISLPLPPIMSMLPPTKKMPGTCIQCQQNPEQKAYCESLARERPDSRADADGQPESKRQRLQLPRIKVPCAEAYALYKQYSTNTPAPSHDEVYQSYIKSNSASYRESGNAESNTESAESRPRQFSAYETDIAAVIATLHCQRPNTSDGAEDAAVINNESVKT